MLDSELRWQIKRAVDAKSRERASRARAFRHTEPTMTAEEALQKLRNAERQADVERDVPHFRGIPCPRCGDLEDKNAVRCGGCNAKLKL